MKNYIYKILNLIPSRRWVALITVLVMMSCEDFVSIDPPKTEIVSATVFSDDASATSAIRGIYSLMLTNQSFTNGQLEQYSGLSSDELTNYSAGAEQAQFYLPSLTSINSIVLNVFWKEAYRYINNANTIIEGLQKSSGVSITVRKQLEGEALFIRAFSHFYLVNLFGEVPYVATTDYHINGSITRQPVAKVYDLIIEDLLKARTLMATDFTYSNGTASQPNKFAASALLARVYLYKGDWQNAITYSTELIQNTTYKLETSLNNVFLLTSKESVWHLIPVGPDKSTGQGVIFILSGSPTASGSFGVALSDAFYNSFEVNDNRKASWVGSFTSGATTWRYPFKYKVKVASATTEGSMMFRLAEQYLIRSEALAQQDKLTESITDLDLIRQRAGLPLIANTDPSISKANLLLKIEQERRSELFAEGGHRWLDLKRTNRTQPVLGPIKFDWQATDELYPIPQSEILLDPGLTQNTGY